MANDETLTKNIYGEDFQDEVIEVEEGDGSLKVTSIEDATRYAFGLSQTREDIKKHEEIAKNEVAKWQERIDQVNSWLGEVNTPLKSKEDYLAIQLQMFHVAQFNAATNEKEQKKLNSIKLPYGITLKSSAQQPEYKITDEDSYVNYAKGNNLVKETKTEVKWGELKKNIIINSEGKALNKETGEFLDFIQVVAKERKFEVK